MDGVLSTVAATIANSLPTFLGAAAYIHASPMEQERMKAIVAIWSAVGIAIGGGIASGTYLVEHGLKSSMKDAALYLASHTIAIGGEFVKFGVFVSTVDLLCRRILNTPMDIA